MRRLLAFIDAINDRGGKVISFLVVFMIAVMTYEVVARKFFDSPTIWADETIQFLLGGYAILGGGYVLRHAAHVNMDVFYIRMSVRRRAIVDLVTSAFFFLFCAVLLWIGAEQAWKSFSIRETTDSTWAPPEYFVKMAIPVGAFLILLQGLAKFIRDLMTAVTGARPE
jgi:TRAP-type mannitol/chloroaromatic compound transport system permease small subunit